MSDSGNPDRRSLLTVGVGGLALGGLAGAATAETLQPEPRPGRRIEGRRRFQDKVVLITGATSGIGAAAARMFAMEAGKVSFCGRRTDRGAQVEREIRSRGGEATFIRADVRV